MAGPFLPDRLDRRGVGFAGCTGGHAEVAGLGIDGAQRSVFIEKGPGISAELRFHPDWEWCASEDTRAILQTTIQPVKNRGVCVMPLVIFISSPTLKLKKENRKYADTHTPQKLTSGVKKSAGQNAHRGIGVRNGAGVIYE